MTEPIRVVIVDDDALVRAGLRMILGGGEGVDVVAEAENGLQALDVVMRAQADVVLMDIRMPVMDGLTAVRELTARGSSARVIVLTTFDADDMVLEALRDGASGFLLKDTAPADLVEAVGRASRGEPTLSPTVATQVIRAATSPGHGRDRDALERLGDLTDREREVAIAVARGLSNADIAAELFLGVATVKTHIGRLFTKLEVANRVQLARRVLDAGLVD